VLQFGCRLPHKGPCVKGLTSRLVLLGGGGTFRRWGLLRSLGTCRVNGNLPSPLLFPGHEVSILLCYLLLPLTSSAPPAAQSNESVLLLTGTSKPGPKINLFSLHICYTGGKPTTTPILSVKKQTLGLGSECPLYCPCFMYDWNISLKKKQN
jgi:hypothetical protein